MPKRWCCHCRAKSAVLKRPKTFEAVCKECFFAAFENEVHETIQSEGLFVRGETVALGASGGKDSTVLIHVMDTLNRRHDYGLNLLLLSIDEGIKGYRDDSLATVKRNEAQYTLPLTILSYEDLYGWTMDEIVSQIGTKSNCTFCGVFRRQALDRGAAMMQPTVTKLATGHNADDIAETVFLNIMRGDVPRLSRCANAITGGDSNLPRVKPFKYSYEKEIVLYAYYKKLDYFSTECVYAPFAARGLVREFVKDLEALRPDSIIDVIRSAERMQFQEGDTDSVRKPGTCQRCGYISSQPVCKACIMLEGLNKNDTRPRQSQGSASQSGHTQTERARTPNGSAEARGTDDCAHSGVCMCVQQNGTCGEEDQSLPAVQSPMRVASPATAEHSSCGEHRGTSGTQKVCESCEAPTGLCCSSSGAHQPIESNS